MSGISARQPARTAKRTRPGDGGSTSAPPVLFRLPTIAHAAATSVATSPSEEAASPVASVNASIASAAANVGPMASARAAAAAQSSAVSTTEAASTPTLASSAAPAPGVGQAHEQTNPAVPSANAGNSSHNLPESIGSQNSIPAQTAAMAISSEKVAGQRLLNILIMLVLLAALVIITWISLQSPRTAGHMAGQNDVSALDSLGDLKVPEIQTGQPVDRQVANLPAAEVAATELSFSSSKQESPAAPHGPAESESLITGLDTNVSGALSSNGPSMDNQSSQPAVPSPSLANAQATSQATTPEPAAQIQLRPAVPVNSSSGSSLVSNLRSSSANEPLTPATGSTSARVETVSRPSSPSSSSPDLNLSEPIIKPAVENPPASSDPRTATQPGASPSLWDGAQNSSSQSLSNRAQTDLSASDSPTPGNVPTITGGLTISDPLSANIAVPPGSGEAAQVATGPTSSRQTSPSVSATSPTATAAIEPAVTVGGGSREPYNLAAARSTSTPESDSAATIQLYQSYTQQRQSNSNAVTAPTGVTSTSTQPINSYAIGAGTPIPGQNLYTQGYVNRAPANAPPTNSYTAAGQISNATPPGVTGVAGGPFVPGNAPANGPSMHVPSQFVGGSVASPPTMLPGYSVPPQTTPQHTTPQHTIPQGAVNPYAHPVYGQPGYPSATHNPGSSFGSGSGFANPSFPTPSATNQFGQPASGGWRPAAGATPSGIQHSASYPVSNSPYPNGQTPIGMMGPSGFATVPSGDFQPPRPVTGTVGYGVSVPNGIQ